MSISNDAVAARICVDLGTAMSKASVWLGGGGHATVAPLPIGQAAGAEQPLLTPSAMFVDHGRIYFGPAALKVAARNAEAKRSPIVSFKMLLSAAAIEATLGFALSRAVDPTRTFTHRDALVLYLAYLDQLIRVAINSEASVPEAVANAPRRITSPNWPSYREAGRIVGRLVEEGAMVSAAIGYAIVQDVGVDLVRARQALDAASAARPAGCFEGIVFESHCAASAYARFAVSTAPYVVVVDIGAGTTDIAGFARGEGGDGLIEVPGTRQCSPLAGDELDTILVDLFMRAGGKRDRTTEDAQWRALRLDAKALKHALFERGRAAFTHDGKTLSVTRETLLNDATFKTFCKALTQTIAASLAPVCDRAKSGGAKSVAVLLAGGGSNLPFLRDLVRAAAIRCKTGLSIEVERFGANWSLPHQHHPMHGMFPQTAISMGGALAPVVELDAAELSQVA